MLRKLTTAYLFVLLFSLNQHAVVIQHLNNLLDHAPDHRVQQTFKRVTHDVVDDTIQRSSLLIPTGIIPIVFGVCERLIARTYSIPLYDSRDTLPESRAPPQT